MRIFVVEPLGQGGLIHYSFHMCRALQREGADVTLITSTDYELEHLNHEFKLNKTMHLWNARQKSEMGSIARLARRALRGVVYVREWIKLLMYLRQEKPDMVLFGEIRFSFEYYFLQMLKRFGLKLADVVHDVRTYDLSKGSENILQESEAHLAKYNRIYNSFDVLFVHDRENRELFLKIYDVPAEKVTEIPHGANEIMLEMTPTTTPEALRKKHGIAPDEMVVLFFGTITKYKGVEDLIRAYPAVHRQVGGKLVIAGFPAKDIDPEELKASAKAGGIEDAVVWFLDYVPNEEVVPYMQMSDVLAMPYRAITQSGILQIAYACGRPVVATRVGGLPDVIEHGKSGWLVDPESPESLSQGIIEVLNQPKIRQEMGARARELAQTRYSWRYVASLVIGAFKKVTL